jgi:hypothetical protein
MKPWMVFGTSLLTSIGYQSTIQTYLAEGTKLTSDKVGSKLSVGSKNTF